ncbi:MAG: histidine--tRNA ligase, partial [Candidatus Omnitrophota bacterium]
KLESNKNKFCQDCQRRLRKNPLRILDCKNKACQKEIASFDIGKNHLCRNCQGHFDSVRSLLDELKISYTYSPYLVRGLDYYTNTVFEVTSSGLGSQDAVGAGGRYNDLIRCLGGPSITAIGFALGIERIMLVLGKGQATKNIRVFVATVDESLKPQAVKLLHQLRAEGLSSDTGYIKKSLKGQLRYAQKEGAKFVVILGESELKEGCLMLRDMDAATQQKIKKQDLISKIKR